MVCQGNVLAEFKGRDNAIRAHLVQFASLYIYDLSYRSDRNDKLFPVGIRNFFDFLSIYFWSLKPKEMCPGKTKTRVKTIPRNLRELGQNIYDQKQKTEGA